ncbi:methyltransferase, putative [Metarhizium acridum CQMa 102]|uniref:Methyltransferase, putative n=1 Tax=Metarhizium acridum (strain CQMa 102) TaxID=655827 RepID=E9EAM4_METAQ|nr:methyltransferase, putative [Metarhizium acridum CQMa 102]EFY87024.1 methyltransferase, putative [Metarhizium acridum CQMa 102]
MTQYDSIGSSYLVVGELLFKQMELAMVRRAIRPLLKPDATIVEFACGTGFYTQEILSWTTSTITSMDISPVMLDIASKNISAGGRGRVRFVLGDGTVLRSYAPDKSIGFFDCAFGGWFLNYAENRTELIAMFATIAHNLSHDGVFVGVVPHPTEDLIARRKAYSRSPLDRMWPRLEYIKEIDEGSGWSSRIHLDEDVSFVATHMKQSTYINHLCKLTRNYKFYG